MKKSHLIVIAFGIFFLFLIQLAGTLVESIYILDLMNTSLDAKALGVLFFFSPVLLLLFRKKLPIPIVWGLIGLLVFTRGLTPYLATYGRMLASGIGTGSALMLLPSLLTAKARDEAESNFGLRVSAGFALGIGLSVFLRTVNYSLDYSILSEGGWVGWGLGLLLGYSLTAFDWNAPEETQVKPKKMTTTVIGVLMAFALALFAFSAPAVIARWAEADYEMIISVVSLLALGWVWLSWSKPNLIEKLPSSWLVAWNMLFTLALTGTILAHRVSFPPTPDSPAVVVGVPTWFQQIPLALMLLLFPVIFVDLQILAGKVQDARAASRDLVPGMLLGSFVLVLLVFMQIFTNVWGYVKPVSPWFRNKFWLPYLLMAGLLTLLVGWRKADLTTSGPKSKNEAGWGWPVFLGILFVGTVVSSLLTTNPQVFVPKNGSLKVMTYNIQQANSENGERSYKQQLALMRQVSPDVLSLQESDSARVSLNNNDYVRYYAGKLGYYSYYGPTTVTGTYGTAILSKFPLQNIQTVFTFSDKDEIGTAVAEIEVDGKVFTIYDVHPDGSDTAMLTFAKTLLARSKDKANVIALGDYNLRDYEEAYKLIDSVYTNAWTSVYPSKISPDGTDMSGENRIDHIFFSPSLSVRNPVYVLPPASATDHAVHWAEIVWGQ